MLHQFRKRDLPVITGTMVIALVIEYFLRPEELSLLLVVAAFMLILCAVGVLWEDRQAKKHPLREPESPWAFLLPMLAMGVLLVRSLLSSDRTLWPLYAALFLDGLYAMITRTLWERKSAREIEERLKNSSKEG